LDTLPSSTASAPVTKPKKPNTSAKHRFGKLSLRKAFKAKRPPNFRRGFPGEN
jgi:hypothetical protein